MNNSHKEFRQHFRDTLHHDQGIEFDLHVDILSDIFDGALQVFVKVILVHTGWVKTKKELP